MKRGEFIKGLTTSLFLFSTYKPVWGNSKKVIYDEIKCLVFDGYNWVTYWSIQNNTGYPAEVINAMNYIDSKLNIPIMGNIKYE